MNDTGIDEWLVLTGRLHPVVVHLPVGILFLAGLFEMLTIHRRFRYLASMLPLIWLTGCAFAVIACVTGLLLSDEGGYDDSLLVTHQWLGISVAVISAAGYWVRSRTGANKILRAIVPGAMMILIMITGHYGGSLTHGDDYLTEPLATIFGLPADEEQLPPLERRAIASTEDAIIYDDVVYPILYDKCIKCHHAGKRKGKLNLADYEEMLAGGKSGETLVPGSPMTSQLYKRIILPEDDRKHMPPKGKPQLSKAETDILYWWISEARASATLRLGDVRDSEKIQTAMASWYEEDQNEAEASDPDPLPDIALQEIPVNLIESLEESGFVVSRVIQDRPFVSVNCVNIPGLTDAGMEMLLPIREHILWLNASDTKITNFGMTAIGRMSNLLRLNIANTAVSDEGLSQIHNLSGLRNLNLVGTEVSDDAVSVLEKMTSLKTLYLWKSNISTRGVDHLRSALPNTLVNAGESHLQ